MLDQTARTQAWLTDLPAIIAESGPNRLRAARTSRKRTRTLKPLWKE